MTLSKQELARLEAAMGISFTQSQKAAILQQFGCEPEPYEWSEQDIAVQIHNYLQHGAFVKTTSGSDSQNPD